MRRLARFLGALVFVAAVVAWGLVSEASFDLFPDRDGLGDFNGQFGVELSERPVLQRWGGFIDAEVYYRLSVTAGEFDEIVRSAELTEARSQGSCLTGGELRAIWWRPTSMSRRRCLGRKQPNGYWLDILYDPATGILHARCLGP